MRNESAQRSQRSRNLTALVVCLFGPLTHGILQQTRGLRDTGWTFLVSLPHTVRTFQLGLYDVVGHAPGAASVDVATCEQSGVGSDSLCGAWVDPDFDPAEPAFYYVRVLQNPSCRWSAYACNALGVACADEDSADGELFERCCDPDRPRAIQERAWSSPIWYTPAESASES